MITINSFLQICFFLIVLIVLAKPLGVYIALVFEGKNCGLDFIFRPVERAIYKICNIRESHGMNWKIYCLSVFFFSLFSFAFVFIFQHFQYLLPLNPEHLGAVHSVLSFNTAMSYMTNTNWQSYSGENTLSYFTQMCGLTVENFVSAAVGMAVLMALIRGIARHEAVNIGNFWVDLVRGILYILLPLALILALLLVTQGVIQNFHPYTTINTLQSATQVIPNGPAASQIAIKQLGSNGGGFFGTNSAHPFENPTPLSNFLEMLAILLIPAAHCFTFGKMVKDKRQGLAIFLVMMTIFIPMLFITVHAEQSGNPLLKPYSVEQTAHDKNLLYATSGGNMEGKEVRFGIVNSAMWTTTTTAVSNGSTNSQLDSYTPIGGLVPLWLMQLNETIFGGVGSGLYVMLIFVILTVFIAGLMVGRTPEYLGKKIEIFEIKMASIGLLVPHFLVLLFTALAVSTVAGRAGISNPGAHGFSEILYAFVSAANNNGSAFAGLKINNFYNITTAIAMFFGRFGIMIPVLAIAGSLARKKQVPVGPGTLPTHTLLFISLVIVVILIIGALAFFPAVALGPLIEHLHLIGL